MYCMACNKQLTDGEDDIFMFKFEGKDPFLAHACDPKDLPEAKKIKYKEFNDPNFCINNKKYFGLVIEG